MNWESIRRSIGPIKTLNSEATAHWLYTLVRPNYFACEVGTYCGYISSMMALAGARTLCIDHMRCGHCDIPTDSKSLYLDAIQSFINCGAWPNIVPVPMKSADAIGLLTIISPSIGLLYLDGDHTCQNVLMELREFDRFIPAGGYVCGDDCTMLDNLHTFNPEITFNKCWDEGASRQFVYSEHDYGPGVSSAVWEYFRDNSRYAPLPDVPANQFGFRKLV